jgi:hypothetical protein
MMFCTQCGAKLTEGELFCVECGNKVSPARPEVTAEPIPVPAEVVQIPAAPQGETVLAHGDAWLIDYRWNPRGSLRLTDQMLTFRANNGKNQYDLDIRLSDVEDVRTGANGLVAYNVLIYLKEQKYVFSVGRNAGWPEKIKQAAVAQRNRTPSAGKQKTDYIDEIRRLKELMDAGIITEEEFTAKKKSLLGL